MTLEADHFISFFQEVYGYEPFPWQNRLLRKVLDEGRWPRNLCLPTASGKTAVLDIALFLLARSADLDPPERHARRIILVVDRRLVVDEAWERASNLKGKITSAQTGILGVMREKLASLGGAGPIDVVRLRGGIPREDLWVQNPLQPVLCLSTVDQVGSRLLFRGYGVSEFSRSVQAGLLAHDSLLFLDEAHLSAAFEDTLDGIRRFQGEKWQETAIPKPLQVVSMSATIRGDSAQNGSLGKQEGQEQEGREESACFSLESEDLEHPVLSKRMTASKMAELVDLSGSIPEWTPEKWSDAICRAGKKMLAVLEEQGQSQPVVAIVVNRVATARAVFAALEEHAGADCLLLVGRSRPLDREKLLARFLPRIRAARNDEDNPQPLFVVATQTVEVGANLDFDGLVTEAASLDALLQRFGREDRLGRRGTSPAAILYHREIHGKEDPVYGDSIAKTWKWLLGHSKRKGRGPQAVRVVDMGVSAVSGFPGRDDPLLQSPRKSAPLLLPAHLDLLSQTSPAPCPDPAVEVFLHGGESAPAEVQVVWRGDLPDDFSGQAKADLISVLGAVSPMSEESLSLPIWTVREWLKGGSPQPVCDGEGVAEDSQAGRSGESKRKVLCWRGTEDSAVVDAGEIKAGETIVVPCSYGGVDLFGWNPSSQTASDLSEEAWRSRKRQPVLRCHPALLRQWLLPEAPEESGEELLTALSEGMEEFPDRPLSEIATDFLGRVRECPYLLKETRSSIEELLESRPRITPYPYPEGAASPGFILFGNRTLVFSGGEDDRASLSRPVCLGNHSLGVAEKVRGYARLLGLAEKLTEDLFLAGMCHDLGKGDPRFQAWLKADSTAESLTGECLLAKSGLNRFDLPEIRAARRAAGYPPGARHESSSVGLLERHRNVLLQGAKDPELVVHLVGTHHGRGRSFMPSVSDPGQRLELEWDGARLDLDLPHRLESLDSGWTERFWKQQERYGWWGLAFLESLLRLADQDQSREEMTS